MAALIAISIIVTVAGAVFAAFLKICIAIRLEDGRRGSLRRAAPTRSAQSARALVGISNSRWN